MVDAILVIVLVAAFVLSTPLVKFLGFGKEKEKEKEQETPAESFSSAGAPPAPAQLDA